MKFNIFELRIFSFNSYVYYLTRGCIALIRAFNLLTCAFNLPTHAFSAPTRAFNLLTRGFELITRRFELVTCRFELVTHGFELVICVLLFHIQRLQFRLTSAFTTFLDVFNYSCAYTFDVSFASFVILGRFLK